MNIHEAWKVVTRIVGKNARYRKNPKALDAEGRAEAYERYLKLREESEQCKAKMEARREELLKNDSLYQGFKAEHTEASKRASEARGQSHAYKLTVGYSSNVAGFGMFSVMAEGDNWADIVRKLEATEKAKTR